MQSPDTIEHLDTLLTEARRNESTWKRFQQMELSLMSCESLQDLFSLIYQQTRRELDCEYSRLQLLDPGFILQRLLEESGIQTGAETIELTFCDREHPFNLRYPECHRPVLGQYETLQHAEFFANGITPRSFALLPLIRGGVLIGSLNLGSLDANRFHHASATDFLQHFSSVIAVCLESMEGRERLKHLGLKDALTGINNRRFFDQRLLEEVSRAQRNNLSLSALFIDIDHFKSINDQYGHKMGDFILQQVAQNIRVQLRTTDTVARYGGEEFAALLCADTMTAVEIAERIRISTHQHSTPSPDSGEPIQVSVSIGIASLTDLDRSLSSDDIAQQLIHLSDTALYHAKSAGRNRTIIYQPE